jgi:ribonuclease P protein component
MFPKPQRLPSIEVATVIRQGKRVSQNGCELRVLPSKQPISRFAVVVPASTHKRAVKRNHIKRCIRESLQHLSSSLEKPCDIVVFGRKELLGKTQPEIEKIVTLLVRQSGYGK